MWVPFNILEEKTLVLTSIGWILIKIWYRHVPPMNHCDNIDPVTFLPAQSSDQPLNQPNTLWPNTSKTPITSTQSRNVPDVIVKLSPAHPKISKPWTYHHPVGAFGPAGATPCDFSSFWWCHLSVSSVLFGNSFSPSIWARAGAPSPVLLLCRCCLYRRWSTFH